MSWDPQVLEIDRTSCRPDVRTESQEKTMKRTSNMDYERILGNVKTNSAVQAHLKRQESHYLTPIERPLAFTPMEYNRCSSSFLEPTADAEIRDGGELKTLTQANQAKYFGENAKHGFYEQYRAISKKPHLFRPKSRRAIDEDEDTTPRTRVAVQSFSKHQLALPLVIRKQTTNVFDFSYQSLGDDYMMQFAAGLDALPFVQEINVRDNRLTDDGLNALLAAISKQVQLQKLDISENNMGAATAKSLRLFLESKTCSLTHLVLEKSDIDDFECAAFMTAFEKNSSVVELRLSRNRIGEAEELNVVQPEITTGGEAIASMLYVNTTMATLDISWNLLRLESSVTLAKSLEFNKKLVELNVAYNACGDAGAMMFGHVLTLNSTLRSLDLSYNNVGSRGALVIASAARVSKSLRHLGMNGNNIGLEGGRALMFAMCSNPADLGCNIEIVGCNLASTSRGKTAADKLFDPTNPAGVYSLDLSDPFDQMIAKELLRLATFKKGCRFEKLKYHSRHERVKSKGGAIQLVHPVVATMANNPLDAFYAQSVSKKRTKGFHVDVFALLAVFRTMHMNPTVETLEKVLEKMKATWTEDSMDFTDEFFSAVFELTDTDGSGGIDASELCEIMQTLGLHMTDEESKRAIAQYDFDNSGTIEDFEFIELMKAHMRHHAIRKSTVGLNPDRFALRDAATSQVWQVPSEGRLEVEFVYEREAVLDADLERNRISDAGIAQLIRNIHMQATSPTERLEMLCFAIADSEMLFSAYQALDLLEQCGGLAKTTRVQAVGHILLQMITPKDAQRLAAITLDLRDRAKLKADLGSAYAVVMGNPTAHFALDLTNKTDRWVACKLAETAHAEKKASKMSKRGGIVFLLLDLAYTSQHMNWENFRNESLDGEKVVLTTSFFNSLPPSGRLEFDYVSTNRPPRGTKALSQRRYEQLVKELAKDCVIIDVPDASAPEDPSTRALRRWKRLQDYVRHSHFISMLRYARSHIFVIKNCREEVRLKLAQIETVVCDRYLTTEQAMAIVMSMPKGFHGRVEAARVLFSRLIDVANFCDILDLLDREEQIELVHTLGWLNVFNPDKPDRYYELDLSVLEDYNMAKILIRLAVIEEGDNWLDGYTYSPSKDEPPFPNWILPASWDVEDTGKGEGPRRVGVLRLTFTSKLEDGCIPDWDARKEVKKRVLCGP
ncbi:unnamed protein product [Aphanomyces euteiches]